MTVVPVFHVKQAPLLQKHNTCDQRKSHEIQPETTPLKKLCIDQISAVKKTQNVENCDKNVTKKKTHHVQFYTI